MGFNYKKYTKAAGKRYGVRVSKKGIQAKSSTPAKIVKDIMWIKSRLNVEKKFVDEAKATANVGQVNVNAQGFFANDIIPSVPQGDGESQRNGNSLKATGMIVKMDMIKQFYGDGPRRLKVCIVKSKGEGYATTSPTNLVNKMWDLNPLTGVRDYHSNLDYTQLKDGRHKIIASRNVYLKANTTASTNNTWERETATLSIPIKLDDVWRYETNGDNYPENVSYTLVILADNGNAGNTASTIVGLFIPQAQSGVEFRHHTRTWYVDN